MMKPILILMLVALASCDAIGGVPSFKVQAEGGPAVTDANAIADYGTSRTIVQRYRFTSSDVGSKGYSWLAVRVTQNAGGKPPRTDDTVVMINDGIGIYECSHYYDAQAASEGPNFKPPVCTFVPLGIFKATAAPELELVK